MTSRNESLERLQERLTEPQLRKVMTQGYMRMYEPPLSVKEYKALLSAENALMEIYDEWNSHDGWSDISDIGYAMEKAADNIQYSLDREKEEALQKPPVSPAPQEPEQKPKPHKPKR